VAAAGGIIANDAGEILFLVRGREPGKGKFGVPGGFVDAGETLENSLIREVLEETSLVVTNLEYLCSFPNTYAYRAVAVDVIDAFYICNVESFDSLKAQPGEVESFYISHPTEKVLNNMAFASNRSAIELFLKR